MPYNLTADEKAQVEAGINSLAYKLAVNWINASLPRDSGNEERGRLLKSESVRMASPHQAFRGERFIAIVGAGASAEAAGLKLGAESSSLIEKRYSDIVQTPDSLAAKKLSLQMKRQREHAQIVFRLDENDFETKLYYLSQIFDIHEDIVEIFGHRHAVSLNYEILSHLFRHRFLDVIINFNFDELLDESIEQECGKDNYTRVISDGECPEDFNQQVLNRKLKRPVYIKPHGTFSHQSTLRFTRKDYYEVPSQILDFMKRLLAGTIVDSKDEKDEVREACEQVNLLILGFGMQSLEMNRILSSLYSPYDKQHTRNTRLNIYYFDVLGGKSYEEKLDDLHRKFYVGNYAKHAPIEKDPVQAESLHFIPIDSADKSLNQGGYLANIYNRILNQFERFYKPSPITRHEIVNSIFERSTPIPAESPEMLTYFRDQLLINLALYAGRNKQGLLGINQLYSNRVEMYFKRYKDLRRKLAKNSKEETVPGCNFSRFESLVNLFEALGLRGHGYGNNIWRMSESIKDCKYILNNLTEERRTKEGDELESEFWQYLEQLDRTFSVSIYSLYNGQKPLHFHYDHNRKFREKMDLFTIIERNSAHDAEKVNECKRLALLYAHLINAVSETVRPKLAAAYPLFIRSISEFNDHYDVINNDSELKHQVKFRNPELLATSLAFRQRLSSIIQNIAEWDYAFAITEQGKMLIPQDQFLQDILHKRNFIIIQADYNADRELTKDNYPILKNYKNKNELKYEMKTRKHHLHHLPWWLHNEHMILFVKKERSKNFQKDKFIWKPVCGFFNPSNLLRDVVTPLFVGSYPNNKEPGNDVLTSDRVLNSRFEDANELARIFVAHYIKAIFWEAQKAVRTEQAKENQSQRLADIIFRKISNSKEDYKSNKDNSDKNYYMILNYDQIEKAYELFRKGQLIVGWEESTENSK